MADTGNAIIKSLIQLGVEMLAQSVLREGIRMYETASETTHVATRVAVHGTGEAAKTSSTLLGSIMRGGSRLAETIFHGIQVAIRVATHIAGEAASTTATLVGGAIRGESTLLEAGKYLITAAIKGMDAVADIPYVGPILALAALASILAAGLGAMGAFAEGGLITGKGGPTEDKTIIRASPGEYMIRASAVQNVGTGFLDAINQGALGARDLAGRVSGGIATPITLDNSSSSFGSGGGGGGGGSNPNIHVAPAPVNVAVINNKANLREFLRSNEGRQILVDEMTAQKMELGLRS
jgi:hypothetical protein